MVREEVVWLVLALCSIEFGHFGRPWLVVPSDGVFTRRHTAECAFCTVFYSVFCFSTMLPWGGEGGGQEQLFLRVMFSAFVHLHWFLQSFSLFRTFFFAPSAFSLGILQCFQASWRCWCYAAHWGGVGWGNQVHVNLTNHVVEASSCCWCYRGDVNVPCNLLTLLMLRNAGVGGMLTFHVTCSRCWCYATLGWGGMLTFHVPCSRCWCYAMLGWGGC